LVSRADLEANAAVLDVVGAAFPDDAVFSEESPDPAERLGKSRVWLIDPLDGTRGYLARTDDFAVHVALAVDGAPAAAVVYQPVGDLLFRAVGSRGAFCVRGQTVERLRVSTRDSVAALRIGISLHNAPPALLAWLEAEGLAAGAVRLGASLKYTALAQGALDAVVTITRTEKEWDTCAPELVVSEAGGIVTDGDGRPLAYNQPPDRIDRVRGIVASNGRCHEDLLRRLKPLFEEGRAL
jgi:3'-phosphoadenosine 5'-phosphosulfate (PAPS) 3'-phosphatase